MAGDVDLAVAAQAIAEPARAAMLLVMMDARQHAASELAAVAGVSASTASAHLKRLHEAGMVVGVRHGRQRLYHLAHPGVAEAVEALAAISPPALPTNLRTVRQRQRLLVARNCYGHLGGRLAVDIAQLLTTQAVLPRLRPGRTCSLSSAEHALFRALGLSKDMPAIVRGCLDWSHNTPHIAGPVGRALLSAFLGREWLTRVPHGRELRITAQGARHFAEHGIATSSLTG